MKNKIRLFWWNEIKIQGKSKENYGDLLGKYLVEKLSGKQVKWVLPKKRAIYPNFRPIYVTIGSILAHVNRRCVVWGSGAISKNDSIDKAKFVAVRGPQTRALLLSKGYEVPAIYGDPAILLPTVYSPLVEKKYNLGIIPHYNEYKVVKKHFRNLKEVLIIDLMTNDIELTTRQILKCKKIISSSLHGLIIPHAYGIPAVWQPFSSKLYGDNIKFLDYFTSVEIRPYTPKIHLPKSTKEDLYKLFQGREALPKSSILSKLKNDLIKSCPFI